jgi:hypothetical protein
MQLCRQFCLHNCTFCRFIDSWQMRIHRRSRLTRQLERTKKEMARLKGPSRRVSPQFHGHLEKRQSGKSGGNPRVVPRGKYQNRYFYPARGDLQKDCGNVACRRYSEPGKSKERFRDVAALPRRSPKVVPASQIGPGLTRQTRPSKVRRRCR